MFTYRIVGKKASQNKSWFEKFETILLATNGATSGSNLLAVDADGNAVLAINTDDWVKVMYTVTDPAGHQENNLTFKLGLVPSEGSALNPILITENVDATGATSLTGSSQYYLKIKNNDSNQGRYFRIRITTE